MKISLSGFAVIATSVLLVLHFTAVPAITVLGAFMPVIVVFGAWLLGVLVVFVFLLVVAIATAIGGKKLSKTHPTNVRPFERKAK